MRMEYRIRDETAVNSALLQDAEQLDGTEQKANHRALDQHAESLRIPLVPFRLPLH